MSMSFECLAFLFKCPAKLGDKFGFLNFTSEFYNLTQYTRV